MTGDCDVTQWIDRMAQGDQQAIPRICEHYYCPLIAVARRKLGDLPQRMVDEGIAQGVRHFKLQSSPKNDLPCAWSLLGEDWSLKCLTPDSPERKLARIRKVWGEKDPDRDSSADGRASPGTRGSRIGETSVFGFCAKSHDFGCG